MYYKITSNTSETRHTLDFYDIDYMLSLHESILINEHIQTLTSEAKNVVEYQAYKEAEEKSKVKR